MLDGLARFAGHSLALKNGLGLQLSDVRDACDLKKNLPLVVARVYILLGPLVQDGYMSVHTDEYGSHAVKQGGGGRNASQGGGAKSTRSGALGTHEIGVSEEAAIR